MADHDYEGLSEKTIDEIKETVKEEDLDLRKLLKAEKNNKDRKTLKEWLNKKIDDQDEWEKDKKKAKKAEKKSKKAKEKKKRKEAKKKEKERKRKAGDSMWKRPKTVFLLGLVIGLALGASALYTSNMSGPGGQAAVSPQQAATQTNTYFSEQLGGTGTNISVGNVDSTTYSDLYVLTMAIQTANQSLQRDVYMSKQSGLLFVNTLVGGSPPVNVETGQPVGTQGQTQGGR
jgi:zona occludens toxin (predicted ATPase)